MATQFASRLASANIRHLHRKNSEGKRQIDELLDGQVLTADVKDKYFTVLSRALDCFMGSFVLDYVEEVCGDSHLTAADPVDARLLDGALVKEWCERELGEQEAQLQAALESGPMFSKLVTGQVLQQRVSKARALVSILKALGRIRGQGAAGSRSSGVQAELSQALLLEQALQMLSWCVRQGLTGQPGTASASTGVHASSPEWLRRVQGRRERRPGHGLFLDDMLQALHVPGGYPFSSIANAVFLLGCVVRDASTATFTLKLGVLAYYLMDLTGETSVGSDGSCSPLLANLAAAFHLPLGTVAAWQAAFLLDAAPQVAAHPSHPQQPSLAAAEGGTELGRACALLVAHTRPDLPIKFIEVLVALGRHDTALVIHRGQAVGRAAAGGMAGTSLQQARTLMELRLRCGLLAEALQLARSHACAQQTPAAKRAALQVLLTALFDWAVTAQDWVQRQQQGEQGQWACLALLELCFTEEEEEVLTSWLVEAARQGRPCGDYLPLMLASRGRVTEALGGFKLWSDHRPSTVLPLPKSPVTSPRVRPSPSRPKPAAGTASAAEEENAVRAGVIDALVNTQAELLTQPQRNVEIGSAPPGTETRAPLPAALVEGLCLQLDADAPVMSAGYTQQQLGCKVFVVPPPFMCTRTPLPPPSPLPQPHSQQHAPSSDTRSDQDQPAGKGLRFGAPGNGRTPSSGDGAHAHYSEGGILGSLVAQAEGGTGANSLAGSSGGPMVQPPSGGGAMMFNLGVVSQHQQVGGGERPSASASSARQIGKRPRNNGLHCAWL